MRKKLKDMTIEERRAYNAEAQRRWRRRAPDLNRLKTACARLFRKCPACGKVLPRTEHFFQVKCVDGDNLEYRCKNCTREACVTRNKKRRYNLSRKEHDSLLTGASCAVCGSGASVCVDHCHATGHVRGTLCVNCNAGIGMLDDNPDLLERAADYLRKTGLHRSGDRRSVKNARLAAGLRKVLAALRRKG